MKNLPIVIADLILAQNNFDSIAYSACFNENAVVFDEGKTHKGNTEIQNWIEKAANEYKMVTKPLEYSDTERTLKAEISGTFPGSPIFLSYHFEFKDQLIESLKIG